MSKVYEAVVTSQGGREGHIKSSDGILDMKVSLPKSLGGNEQHTNPEQLFAAGYAACYENALIHLGRAKKLDTTGSQVTAKVGLVMTNGGADLTAHLLVTLPNLEKSVAQKLIDEAHKTCPYSKATRGNIEVKIELA